MGWREFQEALESGLQSGLLIQQIDGGRNLIFYSENGANPPALPHLETPHSNLDTAEALTSSSASQPQQTGDSEPE